jgi:hypothetical protein
MSDEKRREANRRATQPRDGRDDAEEQGSAAREVQEDGGADRDPEEEGSAGRPQR